ncbi:hypothetical protein WN55_09986 [Dufourea novaeangliae]|uniref:DUF4817 domain-containing protein n=1 Tax=Dufourea novaeangliae TaxID=178035 RepID=A0A154P9M3_DUFNO|nr:hypothetical protein WN55_09986 [Dufourea novaeangliae]
MSNHCVDMRSEVVVNHLVVVGGFDNGRSAVQQGTESVSQCVSIMYTTAEKVEMILIYGEAGRNSTHAQRLYEERHPDRRVPSRRNFDRMVKLFTESGSVVSPKRNRTKTNTNERAEIAVLAAVQANPHVSCSRLIWPARSPDLTPLDFFHVGTPKKKVCVKNVMSDTENVDIEKIKEDVEDNFQENIKANRAVKLRLSGKRYSKRRGHREKRRRLVLQEKNDSVEFEHDSNVISRPEELAEKHLEEPSTSDGRRHAEEKIIHLPSDEETEMPSSGEI